MQSGLKNLFQLLIKYNFLLFLTLVLINRNTYAQIKIDSVVALSRVQKNDENLIFRNPKNEIKIPFDKNFLLIYYTSDSKNIHYSIDGLNNKLMSCRNNGQLPLANLPNGEFELHLKDSISSVDLKLVADSPVWSKWWFVPLALCFIFAIIGIIIYLLLLYRYRQQTKLQRVRNDIASDLHDDVGATLSSISFFGEMMRSKIQKNAPKEEVLPLLEKLISTSKETIETMRGVVWTINPNNDTAIAFFQKLNSFGKEMLAAKNIAFNFEATGFEHIKLPLDIQRNLFLFYKETINNIAKHSKATSVEFNITPLRSDGRSISGEGQGVRFLMEDNGIGFNPADLHEGHGLKSLRKRADELQGNLEIISAQGQGTKIVLTFPLN